MRQLLLFCYCLYRDNFLFSWNYYTTHNAIIITIYVLMMVIRMNLG